MSGRKVLGREEEEGGRLKGFAMGGRIDGISSEEGKEKERIEKE